MALFGKKKQQNTKEDVPAKKQEIPSAVQSFMPERDLTTVIIRPRITEKAMASTERNVYVFEVRRDATKYDIRAAVEEVWGVTPARIRTVTKRPRKYLSRMRGVRTESGFKKAYVYLKEGDSITL